MRVFACLAFSFLAFISGCGGGGAQEGDDVTAGVSIVGQHGVVQIDSESRNLGLVAQGTALGSASTLQFSASVVSSAPMLCIRSPSAAIMVTGVSISGGVATYTYSRSAVADFDWFVFDVPAAAAAHGTGVQVFDASGAIAFDSTMRPMRMAGVASIPDGATAPDTAGTYPPTAGSITAPMGSYAACISTPRTYERTVFSGVTRLYGDGVITSATGASTDMVFYRQRSTTISGPVYRQNKGGKLILVDVSGY